MTILVVFVACSKFFVAEFSHVTSISVVKHCPLIFFAGYSSFSRNNVCIKPSVFQAASFVYVAFIVWINKRILVYLRVFVTELPFYLARTGTDLFFSWNRIVT